MWVEYPPWACTPSAGMCQHSGQIAHCLELLTWELGVVGVDDALDAVVLIVRLAVSTFSA